MGYVTTLSLLLLAATLEAGGDALVRMGVYQDGLLRALWMLSGGVVLLAYAWLLNTPPWEFGRLIGVYVVFFFLIAQAISWVVFDRPPSLGMWVGGSLIVLGGIVMSFAGS